MEHGRDLCWSCQSTVGGEYFCPQCVKVQPLSVWSDCFTVLGLPRKLTVDLPTLERRFYEFSRKFHPDFYQIASSEEQSISLENSAMLNTAYRTLRDPISRVEYLIRLEEGAAKEIPAMAPVDLLEEVLEVQEALARARAGGLDEEARGPLREERTRLEARRCQEDARLLALFGAWDALIDPAGRVPVSRNEERLGLLKQFKEILAIRAYLTKVIEDISDGIGEESETRVSRRRH
jgi:molecular chaperone HscB